MNDWCSYCDFGYLDPDPQDCTCLLFCTVEGCSGESESFEGTEEEETTEHSGETES